MPTHRVWWVAPSLLKPIDVKGYGCTTWPIFDQWDLNKSYIYDCYFLRRPPIPDSVCAYIFHLRVRLHMLFPVNLLHISTNCSIRNAIWHFKVTIRSTLRWIHFSSGQRRAVFSTPLGRSIHRSYARSLYASWGARRIWLSNCKFCYVPAVLQNYL